jgi:hypothetical protein
VIRYALIYTADDMAVAAYLPANYSVIWQGWDEATDPSRSVVVISGTDVAGWTLDDYVLPRLASGLRFGHEIDLSHPIMKDIPE